MAGGHGPDKMMASPGSDQAHPAGRLLYLLGLIVNCEFIGQPRLS
jgi:hypothetical protein